MKRYCAILSIVLVVLQFVLILVSWIVSAVDTSSSIHSIISAGGIRWFVGSLTHNMSSPLLAYIVMGAISYSVFRNSGLSKVVGSKSKLSTQQKFGIRIMALEFGLFVVCLLLATATPHAILLSVTGNLFPSSFSRGIIPLLFSQIFIMSLIYGIIGGTINSLEKLWDAITSGANSLVAVCFIYILAVQLFYSFIYVFS